MITSIQMVCWLFKMDATMAPVTDGEAQTSYYGIVPPRRWSVRIHGLLVATGVLAALVKRMPEEGKIVQMANGDHMEHLFLLNRYMNGNFRIDWMKEIV